MYTFWEELLVEERGFQLDPETGSFFYAFWEEPEGGGPYQLTLEPAGPGRFYLALYRNRMLCLPGKLSITPGYQIPEGPGRDECERRDAIRRGFRHALVLLDEADQRAGRSPAPWTELEQALQTCLPIEGNYQAGGGYLDLSRQEIDELVGNLVALFQSFLPTPPVQAAGASMNPPQGGSVTAVPAPMAPADPAPSEQTGGHQHSYQMLANPTIRYCSCGLSWKLLFSEHAWSWHCIREECLREEGGTHE